MTSDEAIHKGAPSSQGLDRRTGHQPKEMMKMTVYQLAIVTAADPAVSEIIHILDRVRNTLMLVLTTLAIVALTYAGVRYLLAVGDPSGVERAKHAAKSALVGLGLALLAPVVVAIMKQILGA